MCNRDGWDVWDNEIEGREAEPWGRWTAPRFHEGFSSRGQQPPGGPGPRHRRSELPVGARRPAWLGAHRTDGRLRLVRPHARAGRASAPYAMFAPRSCPRRLSVRFSTNRPVTPGIVLQILALESLFTECRVLMFDFTEGEGQHKETFSTAVVSAPISTSSGAV